MPQHKKTRPAVQSNERVRKSNAIVSQPRPVSKEDARLVFAVTIATFALIVWIEAGALTALLYIAVIVPILKLYEVIVL